MLKMLRKAVIPAAGLGTRLLPATKEQPKEMLPVFAKGVNGVLCVKPFVQVVFEKLYDAGFRDFCFIVGRGKRSIEDHFTSDNGFIQYLSRENKADLIIEMEGFYKKVSEANIVFINQPEPKGFGDAVYRAKRFTDKKPFLVHAGDDLIISKGNQCLRRLERVFLKHNADAAFCVQRVNDPQKYGVISGRKVDSNLYQVTRIEEKPLSPSSNLAIIAIYVFSPRIYDAIERIRPDVNDEIQLTYAIRQLVKEKGHIYALEIEGEEQRIEIGTPQSYWKVLTMDVPEILGTCVNTLICA